MKPAVRDTCDCPGDDVVVPGDVVNGGTMDGGVGYFRRRRCPACGGKFSTMEVRLTLGGVRAILSTMVDVAGARWGHGGSRVYEHLIGSLKRWNKGKQ